MLLGAGLLIYVALALVNYSAVQTVIGSAASNRLSQQWGGTVRVQSMSLNIFNHVSLRGVQLITPEGDTVADIERVVVQYDGKPVSRNGLKASRVMLRNGCYCFETDSSGNNLQYILKNFKPREKEKEGGPFVIEVGQLSLRNIHYCMHLHKDRPARERMGVDTRNMDFSNVNGRIKNIRVDGDHITCRFDKFEAVEKSGFTVKQMKMNAYVTSHGISVTNADIETDRTTLLFDALLDYYDWKSMRAYCDSVHMVVRFYPGTSCNMADAAYWTDALWGMDEQVKLTGLVYGPVADLHVEDMGIAFGQESNLHFEGYIYGLPKMDSTTMGGYIEGLHTTYEDLAAVRHPEPYQLKAKQILQKAGTLDADATFNGTIKDFYATIDMNCQLGDLKSDLVMQFDDQRRQWNYIAECSSQRMQVAQLIKNDWLSATGFNLSVQGQGFDPATMDAMVEGQLTNTVVQGNPIDVTTIAAEGQDGMFSIQAAVNDSLLTVDLDVDATLRDDQKSFRLNGNIARADLGTLLHLKTPEGAPRTLRTATLLQGQMQGADFESMQGKLVLSETVVELDSAVLAVRNTSLTVHEANGYKNLTLNSDMFDGSMKGHFAYSDFGLMADRFVSNYVPNGKSAKFTDYTPIAANDFELAVRWHDTVGAAAFFAPQLYLAPGTQLQGNYNFAEGLKLLVMSDSVAWGSLSMADVGIEGSQAADRYRLSVEATGLNTGSTRFLESPRVLLSTSADDLSANIRWNDYSEQPNSGNLTLRCAADTQGFVVRAIGGTIEEGGEVWTISNTGNLVLHNGLKADNAMLTARCSDQQLVLTGDIRGQESDSATVDFNNFDLAALNILMHESGLTVAGTANGTLALRGINSTPYVNAALSVDECSLADQPLGDLDVRSDWDASTKRLNVDLATELETLGGLREPLSAEGYFDLGSTTDEEGPAMQFRAGFDGFNLQSIAPILSGVTSRLEGSLDGDFRIDGTLKNPAIKGTAFIDEGLILVDFLNVVYTFSDSVAIDNREIRLDNFTLHDQRGESAFVNGSVVLGQGDEPLAINLRLNTDNFMFMNTTADNEDYYGTVVAQADGRVTGRGNQLDINVNAQTLRGSAISIPVNDKKQVKDLDYIRFYNPEVFQQYRPRVTAQSQGLNYKMTISVTATPDLKLELPMDFGQMTADVRTQGSGDLRLLLGTGQDFSIVGDYEVGNGTLDLGVMGLFSRSFSIDEGGSINFVGAPLDAIFDIKAVYSQRVNLSSLTGYNALSASTQKIVVENVIALTGELQNPSIGFDIRLPNADQSVEDEVFAFIDRGNERDMLNQTVSLLVMNQFYNSSTTAAGGGGSLIENGLQGGTAVVANTVGNLVSKLVPVVDVNFNYKAATDLTTEQYDVGISKEWNKFYIETTFGFGGEGREVAEVDNNIVGDVLVGYKINPRFHLFVFNRSNTNDYTRAELPYKQGVGLKYSRDFDQLRELFKREGTPTPKTKKTKK